jgi:hypothetical protein
MQIAEQQEQQQIYRLSEIQNETHGYDGHAEWHVSYLVHYTCVP